MGLFYIGGKTTCFCNNHDANYLSLRWTLADSQKQFPFAYLPNRSNDGHSPNLDGQGGILPEACLYHQPLRDCRCFPIQSFGVELNGLTTSSPVSSSEHYVRAVEFLHRKGTSKTSRTLYLRCTVKMTWILKEGLDLERRLSLPLGHSLSPGMNPSCSRKTGGARRCCSTPDLPRPWMVRLVITPMALENRQSSCLQLETLRWK